MEANMAKKSQRLRRARRLERLKVREDAQNQQSPAQNQPDNSVMQAKLKEEKVDVAPDTNFTPNIVEEMIKETEELVSKVTILREEKKEKENEGVTMAVQGEPIERVAKTAKKPTTPRTRKKTTTTTRKPRIRRTKTTKA
tara:strand:+ start:39 stop:458 length:420 start_codon:yes stop_codon:yes gene_type:complete